MHAGSLLRVRAKRCSSRWFDVAAIDFSVALAIKSAAFCH